MVKILHPWFDLDDNPRPFWTCVVHSGGLPWDPATRHYVWAYPLEGPWPDIAGSTAHDTLLEALLEARTWAAMPMVPRTLCYWCRNGATGPWLPRWNIYRGENKMIVPVTLYWDILTGPPP
jgi:hypothetical protein